MSWAEPTRSLAGYPLGVGGLAGRRPSTYLGFWLVTATGVAVTSQSGGISGEAGCPLGAAPNPHRVRPAMGCCSLRKRLAA